MTAPFLELNHCAVTDRAYSESGREISHQAEHEADTFLRHWNASVRCLSTVQLRLLLGGRFHQSALGPSWDIFSGNRADTQPVRRAFPTCRNVFLPRCRRH